MKLRFPVLCFLFVLTSIVVHAQEAEPVRNVVGLYVNPAFNRISNSSAEKVGSGSQVALSHQLR